jgi:hypothetical protein
MTLVERLRASKTARRLCAEAADEIERLLRVESEARRWHEYHRESSQSWQRLDGETRKAVIRSERASGEDGRQ